MSGKRELFLKLDRLCETANVTNLISETEKRKKNNDNKNKNMADSSKKTEGQVDTEKHDKKKTIPRKNK